MSHSPVRQTHDSSWMVGHPEPKSALCDMRFFLLLNWVHICFSYTNKLYMAANIP